MDRRGFLRGILAAGAAPAIVRVASLMPVRPAIIIPTVEEFRADGIALDASSGGNTLLTINMITREALRVLEYQLSIATQVNMEWQTGYCIGDLIRVES